MELPGTLRSPGASPFNTTAKRGGTSIIGQRPQGGELTRWGDNQVHCSTVLPIRYHRRTYREGKDMVESGVTRDVARTYREALQRKGKGLPAYDLALSVYLGHFPT